MISHDRLAAASKKGLLSPDQIEPLLAFLNENGAVEGAGADGSIALSVADAEEMHFARGFHDIFISIGILILFVGYSIGSGSLGQSLPALLFFAPLGAVALSWLLAEWFARRLKLSLPSILLTGLFLLSTLTSSYLLIHFATDMMSYDAAMDSIGWKDADWPHIAAIVMTLLAGWGFYRRFGIPITPALLSVTAVGLLFYLVAIINGALLQDYLNVWLFLAGLACLFLAMSFDTRDPDRMTVSSDKAFWLHLVAAPLLVHALLSNFVNKDMPVFAALSVIGLVVALGFFALVIDRRALLASAIAYLGIAIGILLNHINLEKEGMISVTLLILGLFVLMLGSGWPSLRRIVLKPFSGAGFLAFLPPVVAPVAPGQHTNQ